MGGHLAPRTAAPRWRWASEPPSQQMALLHIGFCKENQHVEFEMITALVNMQQCSSSKTWVRVVVVLVPFNLLRTRALEPQVMMELQITRLEIHEETVNLEIVASTPVQHCSRNAAPRPTQHVSISVLPNCLAQKPAILCVYLS